MPSRPLFAGAIVALATIVASASGGEATDGVTFATAHVRGVATPGVRAPKFLLARLDGRAVSSRALVGRPLLINVFASWCATCRVEEPLLVGAYAKYRTRVAFLGVDEQEGAEKAAGYVRALRVPYPIALDDGQFAASYDTSKIPETILIDARGIVRAVFRGFVPASVLDRELTAVATRKENT